MRWLPACLLFIAFLLSTCENATAKTTPDETEPKVSKETRDVDIIDMISIMNDCNETFRTEMSYIESLNETGSFPDETDKTAKCFVRCLLEKSSVISEEGVVDGQRAPAFFTAQRHENTEDDFRNSTEACSYRNETCICERSYQFVKCIVEMELNKSDAFQTAPMELEPPSPTRHP